MKNDKNFKNTMDTKTTTSSFDWFQIEVFKKNWWVVFWEVNLVEDRHFLSMKHFFPA